MPLNADPRWVTPQNTYRTPLKTVAGKTEQGSNMPLNADPRWGDTPKHVQDSAEEQCRQNRAVKQLYIYKKAFQAANDFIAKLNKKRECLEDTVDVHGAYKHYQDVLVEMGELKEEGWLD